MLEIVAEISSNHLGDLSRALTLIDAAADAGADAVKFQCWTADTMARDPQQEIAGGPWAGKTMGALYRECWTPWDWFVELRAKALERKLAWFSSVFDRDALAFLQSIDCPRYKISSFELTDLTLIRAAAGTGKPLVLSLGMASSRERVSAYNAAGGDKASPTMLHCISAYPASLEDMHLETIRMLQGFGLRVGLSDHSKGWVAPVCAAAMGAVMIEKHLTLLRADGGADADFSMEPDEFGQMVAYVRMAETARGEPRYGPTAAEYPYLGLRRGPQGRGMAVS